VRESQRRAYAGEAELSFDNEESEGGEEPMRYQCIHCKMTWGQGISERDGYSHGLCAPCLREALTPLYRKRQLAEGNFDCFGKADAFCDQGACKYRTICLVAT